MITPHLVDNRKILVSLIIVISLALVPLALNVQLDRTLKSAYVTSSPAYDVYRNFIDTFGDDEFVLAAIKTNKGVNDPEFLKSLGVITGKLESFEEVARVLSLSNLRFFQERKGVFSNYPLLQVKDGEKFLPEKEQLDKVWRALPVMDYLLSKDLNTVGILIRIKDEWRFHPDLSSLLDRIKQAISENIPAGTEFRMTGNAVIRDAVQMLTVRTAFTYAILCMIMITLVTLSIFKNLKIAFISLVSIGLSVEWVLGLMSLAGIPLNATTSLTFGLILVISVATVIYIVTHYYDSSRTIPDQADAVKMALRVIARPSLMCSLVSSATFATTMVSTIPMVQQLGFVMSIGVLIAFVHAMILTPPFLLILKPVDQRTQKKVSSDWVTRVFRALEHFVLHHYRLGTVLGVVFVIVMVAGAPLIKIDTSILRLFTKSSAVIRDMQFVEKHLVSVRSLEIAVETSKDGFKQPQSWKKIAELDKRLAAIPEIASVDSPLPLLEYMTTLLGKSDADSGDLFNDPKVVAQMLSVMSLTADGREWLRRYLNQDFSTMHISVRIRGGVETPTGKIIESIQKTASEVATGWGKIAVTGEQAVFAAQASEVVDSQVSSLFLASLAVIILMTIQMKSLTLVLLSIIPNIPPVAVIFGMMGWFGIPLDNVTVFAAAIAVGLAGNDTIYYLTQLKREIKRSANSNMDIEDCIRNSYQNTSRAMISNTSALFFGFLMLSFTPTLPAIYFGILGSVSIVIALLGDLALTQSVILSFPWIRNVFNRELHARPEV
jgi:uncharacterized protein